MSGDPEQDYFSDGISEDIITALVLILPDGQITSRGQTSCQAPFAKIFSFAFDPNQFTDSCRPVPQEGRLAIVTNAGRDAMDVGSARDERGLLAYGQVVSF
jgi:hypothetical protein